MRRALRLLLVMAFAALVVALLGACGGDEEPDSGVTVFATDTPSAAADERPRFAKYNWAIRHPAGAAITEQGNAAAPPSAIAGSVTFAKGSINDPASDFEWLLVIWLPSTSTQSRGDRLNSTFDGMRASASARGEGVVRGDIERTKHAGQDVEYATFETRREQGAGAPTQRGVIGVLQCPASNRDFGVFTYVAPQRTREQSLAFFRSALSSLECEAS